MIDWAEDVQDSANSQQKQALITSCFIIRSKMVEWLDDVIAKTGRKLLVFTTPDLPDLNYCNSRQGWCCALVHVSPRVCQKSTLKFSASSGLPPALVNPSPTPQQCLRPAAHVQQEDWIPQTQSISYQKCRTKGQRRSPRMYKDAEE
jgi:hypothetical protein